MTPEPLEREIQKAVCDYLTYRRHFWWRNNTGAFETKKGSFVRFGTKGSPDIILVYQGRPYFLEVKRKSGIMSLEQESFSLAARAAGALYHVVRSVDDVQRLGL
jgi:hypothetical protein